MEESCHLSSDVALVAEFDKVKHVTFMEVNRACDKYPWMESIVV